MPKVDQFRLTVDKESSACFAKGFERTNCLAENTRSRRFATIVVAQVTQNRSCYVH